MKQESKFERKKRIATDYGLKFGEALPICLISPIWTKKETELIYDEGEKAIQGKRGPITINEIRPEYEESNKIIY